MPTSSHQPTAPVEAPWNDLESFSPGALRVATASDEVQGIFPARVIAPDNFEQVSAVLAWANEHAVRVIARGGGSKQTWGNVPRAADLVLSLEKFNRPIEHPWQDMTVTVEAGTTIAALQQELAKFAQRLPLDVLWPERSTVGGVIAVNDSGALRLRFGSVRDLLLGVTVVLANGTIARSGGRVVKNVAGYDLPKLFTGSYGTLGVITEVTLRTYPLPHSVRNLSFRFPDAVAANRYMLAVADTTLTPASLQLRIADDSAPIVDLRFEGLVEGIDAQVSHATALASAGQPTDSDDPIWSLRESLWTGEAPAIVGKFSVLPARIAEAIAAIRESFPSSRVIAQSLGLGLFRAHAAGLEQLQNALTVLRASLQKLGGTLVVLEAPLELKKNHDVFGPANSAYPLMVRVKQQFDPKGTLAPGRFLGGI